MAFRPNFQDPLEIIGGDLFVAGTSHDQPLPEEIHVIVEQEARIANDRAVDVAGGPTPKPSSAWRATLPAEGFHEGPALAFGVEIRTRPFMVTTWSESVQIVVVE